MAKRKTKPAPLNNVFNIGDNPRFNSTKQQKRIVAPKGKEFKKFITYTLRGNSFGFSDGDTLVCATEFDAEKITSKSVIVALIDGEINLTSGTGDFDEILGLVVAYQRDVRPY